MIQPAGRRYSALRQPRNAPLFVEALGMSIAYETAGMGRLSAAACARRDVSLSAATPHRTRGELAHGCLDNLVILTSNRGVTQGCAPARLGPIVLDII